VPLVTLTTDFGEGSYVAQVKGVILSLAPDTTIVDVTHAVAPGDVREAAYLVETVVPAFPEDTVHLVVVDPGVGTDRKALAVRFAGRTLVGPDNGVLTAFLGAPAEIRELTEAALFLPEVSPTFNGRDVFAPVTAYLSRGVEFEAVGPVLEGEPVRVPDLESEGDDGVVLHVDSFGNLITNFPADALAARPDALLAGPVAEIRDRARTFGEAGSEVPFLYAGSGGRIEIAVPGGNAERVLGWSRGTAVRLMEVGA